MSNTLDRPAEYSDAPGALSVGWFAIAWHVLALLAVVLGPSQHVRGRPLWSLMPVEMNQVFIMGVVYLVLVLVVSARINRLAGVGVGVALFAASMVCVRLLPSITWSRAVLIESAVVGIVLALLPSFVRRFRISLLGLLALSVSALLVMGVRSGRARVTASPQQAITTTLVTLRATVHRSIPRPPDGPGGGLSAYGMGFVLVTGGGQVYRLEWNGKPDSLAATHLPLTVPQNRAEFLSDQPTPPLSTRLRGTDLVIDTTVTPARIIVAHQYWNHAQKCLTMRVSATGLSNTNARTGDTTGAWTTLYDSHPCVHMDAVYTDTETGGRLAWDSSHRLLFSLGDMGADGLAGVEYPQAPNADYGKVLRLDGHGGAVVFTSGHRNPQGLLVDHLGRVWETEHGPRGGDELNLLIEGRNYGWPLATYGTDYARLEWPLAPKAHNHGSFEEPMQAFVPSVAVSNLIEVGGRQFPEWEGDLLVGSLKLETLYRMRLVGSRVVYVEAIRIGERIRTLAQGADGRILLWTDSGAIVVVERAVGGDVGTMVYDRACASCHDGSLKGPAVAPVLRGIVGRRIAAQSFEYSSALRAAGGAWTPERLDAYVRNPRQFAPGTSMTFGGLADAKERRLLIEFLQGRY